MGASKDKRASGGAPARATHQQTADGMQEPTHQQKTALFVGAFMDELVAWGVRDVVVSPGSRSTALAVVAYEYSRRFPKKLCLYMDIDERGAAFFGLGLAKASGRPVALVCTSGTALANYYPAVIEACTSRVPLIVLSGDRPERLQGLGAPQTCDQLKAYGSYVRAFRQMPLPGAHVCDIAFARQAAREACLAALGGQAAYACEPRAGEEGKAGMPGAGMTQENPPMPAETQVASRGCASLAGPVQVNFPFDEPLMPDVAGIRDAFAIGRRSVHETPLPGRRTVPDAAATQTLLHLMEHRLTLVLAGEGTCTTLAEVCEVMAWANQGNLPVLADPLSGLRAIDDCLVIDNYDSVCGHEDWPAPELVIRFGRYPVSKRATSALAALTDAVNVVVDMGETRDFNCATDMFVAMTPLDFVRGMRDVSASGGGDAVGGCGGADAVDVADGDAVGGCDRQRAFAHEWQQKNAAARMRTLAVGTADEADMLEGAYVRALLELAPACSCVFSANSMAIRALDTFYVKDDKPLCVLCNRGQNGIDGTTSAALGAAQHFKQTTFLTGDFTLLHDMSALAMQHELMTYHNSDGQPAPSVAIVLLNNNGGAIFDTLPQASDDPSFERLFLAPQDVDFGHAAAAFGIAYQRVCSVDAFGQAYESVLGMPGISILEVRLPLRGVEERYVAYQQ